MNQAEPVTADRQSRPGGATAVSVKLTAVAVSTLVALLLLEVAVRLLGLAPTIIEIGVNVENSRFRRSANPILGYELRPGTPGVNSQGMFGPERSVKKPPGTRRIILLGDSVLEPFDKPESDYINVQMEKLLESRGSGSTDSPARPMRTEVLNMGVGGYNTLMEVEALRVKGLQFEPDVVIIVFVENDFENVLPFSAVLAGIPRPAWVNGMYRSSHLFRLVCLKLDWFGFRSDADPVRKTLTAIGTKTNNVARALPLFKELSVRHRFEPWIAIWPSFGDRDVTDVHFLPDGKTLVIEALAAMADVPAYRLSEFFKAYLQSQERVENPRLALTWYGDGMHPNTRGARMAAQGLIAMLESPRRHDTNPPAVSPQQAAAAARAALALGNESLAMDYASALLDFARELELENQVESFRNAVRYYETALRINPNHFDAHFRLGRVWLKLGARDKALGHFRRALELRPDDPEARKYLRELAG